MRLLFNVLWVTAWMVTCSWGWVLDDSCRKPQRSIPDCSEMTTDEPHYLEDMSSIVTNAVESAFFMAGKAKETLDTLKAGQASQAQIDLLKYLFAFGIDDNDKVRSDKVSRISSVFEQVLAFKDRNGAPSNSAGKLLYEDVVVYCDFSRMIEYDDCEGFSVDYACDTESNQAIAMDELYRECSNPPPGEEGPYGFAVNFNGQSNSFIQLCPRYLEGVSKWTRRSWTDAAADAHLAEPLEVTTTPEAHKALPVDLAKLYDSSVLHELTHCILNSPTEDVWGRNSYEWANCVKISRSSATITDDSQNPAMWNADNYAMFGEGSCFIDPPDKIPAQRFNEDGTISRIRQESKQRRASRVFPRTFESGSRKKRDKGDAATRTTGKV